jgi:hypothetical protein
MKTITGPSQCSTDNLAEDETSIFSLPLDRFLFGYVDEIFSDYSAQRATLLEVRDEIKAIIEELISRPNLQRAKTRLPNRSAVSLRAAS